jgi:hypothetical protein
MKKRAVKKAVRKEYKAPKLTVYGKVSKLTQHGRGKRGGRGGHGGSRS